MKCIVFAFILLVSPCLVFCNDDFAYLKNENIIALLKIFFPKERSVNWVSNGYEWRNKRPNYKTLNEVLEDVDNQLLKSSTGPVTFEANKSNIDSYLLYYDGYAKQVLEKLFGNDFELLESFANKALLFNVNDLSVLEKALFQRDLIQIFAVVDNFSAQIEKGNNKDNCEKFTIILFQLMKKTLFSKDEILRLKELLPKKLLFGTTYNTYDLDKSYIPDIVNLDEKWIKVEFENTVSRHYITFAGKSFIKIHIKPYGMSKEQFYNYWDKVYGKWGADVISTSDTTALPAKTETMLIRTFGLLTEELEYIDSNIPETITLRTFKYKNQKIDLNSSDFRGTYQFVYKMNREKLLTSTDTLGLVRFYDNDPSYIGFYGDVPDFQNAIGDGLNIVRNNCISCHSLQYYGSSTVFSLGQKRKGYSSLKVDNIRQELFTNIITRVVFHLKSK